MSGIGKWKGGARYVTGRPVKLNNDGSFPECDEKHTRYHEAHKDERKAADILTLKGTRMLVVPLRKNAFALSRPSGENTPHGGRDASPYKATSFF